MKMRLSKKQLILTAAGIIIVGGIGGYALWERRAASEEYITAKIERGAIRNTVSATGTLQAVTTVQVGSQVSGTIAALYADFNSIVRKGQVVAQLDPRIFEAQLASQRANLEQARASLADAEARVIAAKAAIETQRAGVSGANANLAALKAQRDDALSLLRRQETLAKSGIVPERDLESARTNFNAAEARYNQAVAQLDQARVSERTSASAGLAQAEAQVKQSRAQLQQTEASLKLAEVNLSHTTITSPIDGVVVSRNVDKGQTVAASLSAPTLFTIANDLTQMQVIANIDQADIGVINQSNRVNFTVDAFPGVNFGGTINQIRLNPQNVQNVVTYNVVIDVKNPDLKLKPGMTANLTMTIAERQDVMKIPNAALRFRPQGVTPEKLRELLRGADTQAGGGAGRDVAKDTNQNPGRDSAKGAAREGGRGGDGMAAREGGRGGGRMAAGDASRGGDRATWRNAGGGGDRTLSREAGRGGGGEAGANERRGDRAEGQQREGDGGGRRRDWAGRGDDAGSDDAGGGQRRDWRGRSGEVGSDGGGAQRRDRPGQSASPELPGAIMAGEQLAFPAPPVQEPQTRIVWVLGPDNKPQPRRVKLGITDGTATEVIEGDLKQGEMIIVGQNISAEERTQNNQQRAPGFGGAPGGRGPGGFGGGRR